MFTQVGWNLNLTQQIAEIRGAATLQDKDWGAIITWKYTEPPYLDSGANIYNQMVTAYNAGAKYITIFNYPYNNTDNIYGTLTDEHFRALERFWNNIHSKHYADLSRPEAALDTRTCRGHHRPGYFFAERSPAMSTGTVTLHRVLRAPPERVYRAFLDPDAMAKWLPPHGFTGRVLHMDARVGGTYRMQFTNLSNGQIHAFGGEYLELVPNERIVNTDRFDDPNLTGEMRTTVMLRAVSVGTELTAVQQGIPAMIPTEACYLGWQESLQLLALLVEPEIPA
jgi:uncharacterized protein YndB with AHSA1/START domain